MEKYTPPEQIYNPKNPDIFKQVEIPPLPLPELNIVPLSNGLSTIKDGDFQSKNFRVGSSGYRLRSDGTLEAREGVFSGTFNIGGTQVTINSSEDIQENLDKVFNEGGGTVYLQNGTYLLDKDINIPSGVILEGVSRDGVIIDCNNIYGLGIVGTANTDGTVTISYGDTTVVGSSTSFDSSMIGLSIFIDGYYYEISTVTDTTHLELVDSYFGNDVAGVNCIIADLKVNSGIMKLTVENTNAGYIGVYIQYAREIYIDDIIVYNCGTGVDVRDSLFPRFLLTAYGNGVNLNFDNVWGWKIDFSEFSSSVVGAGVVMTNSGGGTFIDTECNSNTGNGITLTSCSNITFISSNSFASGGKGIELVSNCNDIQFIGFSCDSNTSDGIKLTATSDRNTIVASSITNNGGYGINIAASTCDNNQIIAPAFDNNTSGNINDSGTNTFISPQETSDVQTFTSNGTWTKPSFGNQAFIQIWGAGGGGGKNSGSGTGGGGGGSYNETLVDVTTLGATESVTIGTGGTGATSGGLGNSGGASSFGTLIYAYGGGGGGGGASYYGGVGGGGISSAGSTPASGSNGGNGGGYYPRGDGGGIGATSATSPVSALGGGGGGFTGTSPSDGGDSYYGGGGGGGSDTNTANSKTGGYSTFGGGGGGGAGNGGGGAGGISTFAGNGGDGGDSATNTAGSNGVSPAGGGGAGGGSGNGGNGANGKCIVTVF